MTAIILPLHPTAKNILLANHSTLKASRLISQSVVASFGRSNRMGKLFGNQIITCLDSSNPGHIATNTVIQQKLSIVIHCEVTQC